MTILHSGSNPDYSKNHERAFGGGAKTKAPAKAAAKAPAKPKGKKVAKKAAKK